VRRVRITRRHESSKIAILDDKYFNGSESDMKNWTDKAGEEVDSARTKIVDRQIF
jgi:hypothetical protein